MQSLINRQRDQFLTTLFKLPKLYGQSLALTLMLYLTFGLNRKNDFPKLAFQSKTEDILYKLRGMMLWLI